MRDETLACPQCGSANVKRAPNRLYRDEFILLRRPWLCRACRCMFEPRANPAAALFLVMVGAILAGGALVDIVGKVRTRAFGFSLLVACIGVPAGLAFAKVGVGYLWRRECRILRPGRREAREEAAADESSSGGARAAKP